MLRAKGGDYHKALEALCREKTTSDMVRETATHAPLDQSQHEEQGRALHAALDALTAKVATLMGSVESEMQHLAPAAADIS